MGHNIFLGLPDKSKLSYQKLNDIIKNNLGKIKERTIMNLKLIYFLAKFFYKFSDLIITNSNFEKKYIKEKFKLNNVICIHPPSITNIIKTVFKKT